MMPEMLCVYQCLALDSNIEQQTVYSEEEERICVIRVEKNLKESIAMAQARTEKAVGLENIIYRRIQEI